MRTAVFLALIFATASASAAESSAMLGHAQLDRLNSLAIGASVVIDAFPDGAGGQSSLRFERFDVYAPGARVVVVDASGEHELPRSPRIELIGADAAGNVRASLSFDPGVENLSGVGTTSAGTFVVSGVRSADGVTLHAVPVESTYPPGVVPQILSDDDALPSGRPQPSALEIALAGQPSGSLRNAVVAVDTDNEFMSERFNNNTTAATAWIADLFTTMNVMYRRDLDVNLQQGSTMLRTTTDPYSANNTPADGTDLDEFGTYWQNHYAAIQRSFATLLSGKASSGNSASGIAWVNAYCETQSQGGSYSITQIFTNPQIDVSLTALVSGHELGHNFGAFHTHCTDVTTGFAPTPTNTIDKCWNESGCYNGQQSCPTSGPGAPAGTIMSYCNQHQCGPTGQNVAQFHPTQITVLNAYIALNTATCLNTTSDIIFGNGFD